MRRPAEPTSAALTLLHVLLLLWGHAARHADAAFQLPPLLRTLSEQSLGTGGQAEGFERPVYSLPVALPNVPNLQRYLPRKKHLKPHKLRRRLRKDWDPFWMSVERPVDAGGELVKQAPVDPSLVKAVDRLNFSQVGPDGMRREVAEEAAVRRVMSAWLLQRAACNVYYVWDDLGVRYWPRWVRRGSCQPLEIRSPSSAATFPSSASASSAPSLSQSCSWPPGMSCVPAESRRIRILRWTCRHNKAFKNWNPRFSSKGRRPRKPRKGRGRRVNSNRVSAGRVKRGLSLVRGQVVPALVSNAAEEDEEEEEEEGRVDAGVEGKRAARAVVLGRGVVGGEEEEDINDTENWSRKPFKERRNKLSMRCKWKKIPYPVVDDCYCSC